MAGMVGLQTSHRYGNATFLESDFVLGIGNRWANRHTGGSTPTGGDATSSTSISSRPRSGACSHRHGIVSDARAALDRFVEVARERGRRACLIGASGSTM